MTALVEEFGSEGSFVGSESLEDFVASIQRPRAVIVIVKAGDGTDAVIDDLQVGRGEPPGGLIPRVVRRSIGQGRVRV